MVKPTTVGQATGKVLRGGAYNNNSNNAACVYRNNNNPNNNFNNNLGFRVVAPMPFCLSEELICKN
jgi:formylglycine-generating enzyme required for sulfatase activity